MWLTSRVREVLEYRKAWTCVPHAVLVFQRRVLVSRGSLYPTEQCIDDTLLIFGHGSVQISCPVSSLGGSLQENGTLFYELLTEMN